MAEVKKGSYHYKCTKGKTWTAKAFGDMADGMPECSGATMQELEAAMYAAVKEASGKEAPFTYACDAVTPKTALFTADIDTVTVL